MIKPKYENFKPTFLNIEIRKLSELEKFIGLEKINMKYFPEYYNSYLERRAFLG